MISDADIEEGSELLVRPLEIETSRLWPGSRLRTSLQLLPVLFGENLGRLRARLAGVAEDENSANGGSEVELGGEGES